MGSSINSLPALESDDTKKVLDVIDGLRSLGISKYVDLPQIIVCGEQSCGKSSVLEAISGLSFPTKDTVCTRFATEVRLRRDSTSTFNCSIVKSTISGQGSEQAGIQLSDRSNGIDHSVQLSLEEAIKKAEVHMGISDGGATFSSDIFRVESSGPDQPNLTFVDLPGLYQAGSKSQSDADAEVVKSLVKTYMRSERSIILAVVSAKSEFNNQVVTRLAREVDPSGQRTLGLITKPDYLHPRSELEEFYIRLAQNNEVPIKLGWHVLRNRGFPERDFSLSERHAKEKEFFSSAPWTKIDAENLGIDRLKRRLSKVLRNHILAQLPDVVQQIDDCINECKPVLASLGAERSNPVEQRAYLLNVSHRFYDRLKDAIDGTYTHPFFEDATADSGYQKRLRAVIQNTLSACAEDIRAHGHTYHIHEAEDDNLMECEKENSNLDQIELGQNGDGDDGSSGIRGTKNAATNLNQTAMHKVRCITREDYLMKAIILLRRSRGRELPGLFNPLVIGDLFHEQCRPWKEMITECMKVIVNATYEVLKTILDYSADKVTKVRLLRIWIDPRMDRIKDKVDLKIGAILGSHFVRHAITYNGELNNLVQGMQEQRLKTYLRNALGDLFQTPSLQAGRQQYLLDAISFEQQLLAKLNVRVDESAASLATDFMQAYYQIAREDLMQTVSTQAVEECIIEELPSLFSAEAVLDMDDAMVTSIASESKSSAHRRKKLKEKLDTLERGRDHMKRFQIRHVTS